MNAMREPAPVALADYVLLVLARVTHPLYGRACTTLEIAQIAGCTEAEAYNRLAWAREQERERLARRKAQETEWLEAAQ